MNIPELIEINKHVCSNLWSLAYVGQNHVVSKADITGLSPKLVIPTYHRNPYNINLPMPAQGSRISEQESRVLFCDVLNNTNYFYAIETPTLCKYDYCNLSTCFDGTPPAIHPRPGVSANSDLSIYQQNGIIPGKSDLIKLANVEFKAHNCDDTEIYKDVIKLCYESNYEQIWGNWFHTLKNLNSGTIPSLFNKFNKSFSAIENANSNEVVKNQSFPNSIKILFCFCVLEKKWGCTGIFEWSGSDQSALSDYAASFFAGTGKTGQSFDPQNSALYPQWTFFK